MIKEAFKKYIYRKFRVSFSTAGEDVLLHKVLSRHVRNRFYVDIGAFHPIRYSNSYFFYLRGWNGICVDANPKAIANFRKERPRDISVNKGVSDSPSVLKYYVLHDEFATMNTFDRAMIVNEGLVDQIKEVIDVECLTLNALLDQYLPTPQYHIDFLSLDVEGYDLKVLRGNDWTRHRPTVLCVELNSLLRSSFNSELVNFLDNVGYELVGKTLTTHTLGNMIFIDRSAC